MGFDNIASRKRLSILYLSTHSLCYFEMGSRILDGWVVVMHLICRCRVQFSIDGLDGSGESLLGPKWPRHDINTTKTCDDVSWGEVKRLSWLVQGQRAF